MCRRSPLHIKPGSMKKFIKVMIRTGDDFMYLGNDLPLLYHQYWLNNIAPILFATRVGNGFQERG